MARNLFLVLLLCFGLAACGYGFASRGPVNKAVAEQAHNLYMDEVVNPTLEAWLGPRLRSVLRDELHRRGWTNWTERNEADALVKVVVEHYSRSTKVSDEKEETLRSQASIKLYMTLVSRTTGQIIWHSGMISVGESYFGSSPVEADKAVTELAVRRLVDRLSQGY
ncbi:MAG: DUF4136 domain-containing protein [Desulfovibrionaceae bacterium]